MKCLEFLEFWGLQRCTPIRHTRLFLGYGTLEKQRIDTYWSLSRHRVHWKKTHVKTTKIFWDAINNMIFRISQIQETRSLRFMRFWNLSGPRYIEECLRVRLSLQAKNLVQWNVCFVPSPKFKQSTLFRSAAFWWKETGVKRASTLGFHATILVESEQTLGYQYMIWYVLIWGHIMVCFWYTLSWYPRLIDLKASMISENCHQEPSHLPPITTILPARGREGEMSVSDGPCHLLVAKNNFEARDDERSGSRISYKAIHQRNILKTTVANIVKTQCDMWHLFWMILCTGFIGSIVLTHG